LLAGGLRIDYLGFVLVALGFGALQIVMDRYQREDGLGSPFIVGMLAVSVVSLVVLVIWEWFHPQPVMNVRLFRIPSFAICNVILFGFGFIIYGTTTLLPQLTQELLGYTATSAGLALALGGIITVIMMPISGMITGRLIQPKYLICAALLLIAGGMVWDQSMDLDMTFGDVSFSRAALAMWLPFIFIPIAAVQFIGVPPKQNNDASAILTLTRNFGGSAGISFVTNLLAQREQFHGARLAEHVTPAVVGHPDVVGLLHLAARVQQQAAMLSYLDVFAAFAVGAALLAPLALFLPRLAKGAAVAAH
jgi:DHA2 family multidrug resistance protein